MINTPSLDILNDFKIKSLKGTTFWGGGIGEAVILLERYSEVNPDGFFSQIPKLLLD